MKKTTTRGAALVEYAILTGLISVVSIGSVMSLGTTIKDGFDVAANELAEKYIEPVLAAFGIMAPTGPVSDWTLNYSGSEVAAGEKPDWVTESGGTWTIQLAPVFDHFPEGQAVYYDAYIYQDGIRTVGSSGQCAYTLRPRAFFSRTEGSDRGILGGIASPDSGTSDCTPNSSQKFTFTSEANATLVPTFAESVYLWTTVNCSNGATCENGNLLFDIRFYTQ